MNFTITNHIRAIIALAIMFIGIQYSAFAAPIDAKQKAEFEKIVENYILNNPEIIQRAIILLQQQERDAEARKSSEFIKNNWDDIANPENLYIGGNLDGDVTLIEFFDYNCGYCKQAYEGINKIVNEDANLKIVMYELPILAQSSLTAARVSLAANIQGKYWEFHAKLININGTLTDDIIFETAQAVGLNVEKIKQDMASEPVEQGLITSARTAEALKINGTPAIIINGKLFPGAIGYDQIKAEIASARNQNLLNKLPNN